MITIKKKTILLLCFIFFLLNILLILHRRDFNFYNFKLFFNLNFNSKINKDINELEEINKNDVMNQIYYFLNNNKIKEVNLDKDAIRKLNYNIEDIIFHFYPIKIKNSSRYIISNFYNDKYDKCTKLYDDVGPKKYIERKLTIYLCK